MILSHFRLRERSKFLLIGVVLLLSGCSAPAFYLENDLRIKEGQVQSVITDYKIRLSQDKQNSELLYKLAEAYLAGEEILLARETIKTALLLEPQVDKYQFLAGKIAFQQTDYFNAITHLTNVILLNSRFLEAYYLLAQAYEKSGQIDNAINQLERAVSLEPLYFDAHLLKYQLMFEKLIHQQPETQASSEELLRKKGVDLLNSLNQALLLYPRSLEGNLLLARIYDSLGMRDQALDTLKQLLTEYPENDQVLYQLALWHYRSGEFDKAVNQLERLSVVHLNSRVLLLKSRMAVSPEGDYAAEIEALVQTSPTLFDLYCLSAENDLKNGRLGVAEIAAQQCIALKPENGESYLVLSRILAERHDEYGYRWALRKAYTLAPFNPQIRLAYIKNLLEQQEVKKAENILNHPSLSWKEPEVLLVRGLLAKAQRDYESAIDIFEKLETIDYSTAIDIELAQLDILTGKYNQAESRLGKLKSDSKTWIKRDLTLAQLYQKTGKHSKVLTLLKKHQQSANGKGFVHIALAESSMALGNLGKGIGFCEEGLRRWPKHLELIQYYTFLLGLDKQYVKAIKMLEKMQSGKHRYNELFFHRLRQYYFKSGNTMKLNGMDHPHALIKP